MFHERELMPDWGLCATLLPQQLLCRRPRLRVCKGVCYFLHNRRKQGSFVASLSEFLGFFITMIATTLCALTLKSIVGIYHRLIWTRTVSVENVNWTNCADQQRKKSETPSWTYLGLIQFCHPIRLKNGWFKFGLVRGCNSSCRGVCKDVYLRALVSWDSKFPLPWVSKGLFTALTKKTLLNTSCVSFKRVRWTKHNKGWQLERGCVQFKKRNVLNRTDKPATKTSQMCLYVGRRGLDCSLKWFFCLLTACSVAPRRTSWWHLKLDLSKPTLQCCSDTSS